MQLNDQTARSVQTDLDLHCPQKFPMSSKVAKELKTNLITLAGHIYFVVCNVLGLSWSKIFLPFSRRQNLRLIGQYFQGQQTRYDSFVVISL